MAQNELFSIDEMLSTESQFTTESKIKAREKFKATGRQQGDAITDRIMSEATHIVRAALRQMDVDLEALAAEEDMEIDDLLQETDVFYELVSDLTRAYLEGLEYATPFPFLD